MVKLLEIGLSVPILDRPTVLSPRLIKLKSDVEAQLKEALETFPVKLITKAGKFASGFSSSPSAYRNLLSVSIFGIVFTLASYFTGEPLRIVLGEAWIWATMFANSIVYVIAARRVVYTLSTFCLDQFDEAAIHKFNDTIKHKYNAENLALFHLVVSVLMTSFLGLGFYFATSTYTPVSYGAAFVVALYIASWIYGASILHTYTKFVTDKDTNVNLYPLDPANSVVIKGSEDIIKVIGYAIAIILAFYIPGPVILDRATSLYSYVGIGLIVIIAIAMFVVFFVSNQHLQDTVRREKHIIADTVQGQIRKLLAERNDIRKMLQEKSTNLSDKDIRERLEYLIALHEKILKVEERSVFSRSISQTFKSLVIPTAVFLISNFSTIYDIIKLII